MPKEKKREQEETSEKPETQSASRAIWKGNISFGLVNIPVSLHAAESRNEIRFKLLDRKNMSPIHYKRVDEATGQEVDWSDIVHGYEYEPGQYVVINDDDLKRANVEATQTVEIMEFVEGAEISPRFFDKPYYLQPDKKARKSYALLREVMRRTGKYGIGKIVLRSRQYIAAVFPEGDVIVVNLLRYPYELRDASTLDLPEQNEKSMGMSDGEIRMAERLVESMVDEWNPQKYHDTYRDDIMQMIQHRIDTGQTAESTEPMPSAPRPTKVVDIMDLLKRSVEQAEKSGPKRKQPQKRKAG
jgi:DNA end-binding protein Ku